jgi:hypothetical protein
MSEHLGLLSILISWCLLIILIRVWKGKASMTLSQHAAQVRASRIYYAVMWTFVLPPFMWFMINPFARTLELPSLYTVTALITGLLMAVAAYVPEVPGWRHHVHRYAAFAMAALFMPLVALVIFSSQVSRVAQIICILALVYMAVSTTALSLNRGRHAHLLIIQSLYVLAFHISILTSYYIR